MVLEHFRVYTKTLIRWFCETWDIIFFVIFIIYISLFKLKNGNIKSILAAKSMGDNAP
jgi:hypothetical protein